MEHAHYGPLGGVEPIFLATTDDMLKLLVTHGASVNCKTSIHDEQGYCYDLTPLHLACAAGDVPGMKILIDAKADVNAMCATEPSWDDSAYSPLHLAITTPAEVEWPWPTVECNLEAVRTLVMAGADVEAGNISGCGTPLDYAVGWDCVPIVKLLLVAGANPGGGKPENDGFRCTPLHTVIAHIKNMFARKRQAWDELEQDVQAAAISKFMDGISDLFEIGRLLIVAGAPLEVRAESALFHSECGMPGPSMTPLMLAEHLRAQHSAAGDPSAADKDEKTGRDSMRKSILSALEALIGLMCSIKVEPAAASSTAATEDKPKGKRQRAEY